MCIDFVGGKFGCDEVLISLIFDWIDGWVMCVSSFVICVVYVIVDDFFDYVFLWNCIIFSC